MIAAVISGGTAIITALGTKEVDTAIRQQNEKAGIKDVFKAVAQNDQLMWLALLISLMRLPMQQQLPYYSTSSNMYLANQLNFGSLV